MKPSCTRMACDLQDIGSIERCCSAVLPLVKTGGVWIAPSNTVYGISGNALLQASRERIRAMKERGAKPFIVLVRNANSARQYARLNGSENTTLAGLFAGGMLTLVLPCLTPVLGNTIAVRIASDPFSRRLLEKIDVPLISTSANSPGTPYSDDTNAIYAAFSHSADSMVDAGPLGNAQPSCIVDMTGARPAIIREGMHLERVRHALA